MGMNINLLGICKSGLLIFELRRNTHCILEPENKNCYFHVTKELQVNTLQHFEKMAKSIFVCNTLVTKIIIIN